MTFEKSRPPVEMMGGKRPGYFPRRTWHKLPLVSTPARRRLRLEHPPLSHAASSEVAPLL